MSTRRTGRCHDALRAIEQLTALPAVSLCLEGRAVVAAFEPSAWEHQRRASVGAGAVTSRAVLHGLWLLPAGIPVPTGFIPDVKRRRLRAASHFAVEDGACFERLYSPAGAVRTIAFVGKDVRRNVEHAIRFTPIVERVVVSNASSLPSRAALDLAGHWGVGVVVTAGNDLEVLVHPRPAVVGVPAVYRWWLAELAYERWLQQSAQPVS